MKLTTLITRSFFPGLQTLAYSLSHYGKVRDLDWHVIWADEPIKDYESVLSTFGFNAITHHVKDFPAIQDIGIGNKRLLVTKYKLLAFLLPPDDLYTFIDSDLVCKRDAREMLNFKHFSAESRPGVKGFCSGLWTFKPSVDVFRTLVTEIIPLGRSKEWRLPDQDVLNEYYTYRNPEQLIILDWKWNTSKREIRQDNWLELYDEAIFIHYHGKFKPWLADEKGYELTHDLWHKLYAESKDKLK